jgi:hypothetical protein
VQGGYFLCHGKAQAVALRPVAGVPLIELLKDMAAGLGVHTAAMVRDSHNRVCPAHSAVLRLWIPFSGLNLAALSSRFSQISFTSASLPW